MTEITLQNEQVMRFAAKMLYDSLTANPMTNEETEELTKVILSYGSKDKPAMCALLFLGHMADEFLNISIEELFRKLGVAHD